MIPVPHIKARAVALPLVQPRLLSQTTLLKPASSLHVYKRTMSTKPRVPVVPRPSASLVIVNDHNEVLLVQRNAKQTFGGVHVFPGGNYDPEQDDNFYTTALRETFEESGLLLCDLEQPKQISTEILVQARAAIHSQKLLFKDFLREHGLTVNTSRLLPFTEWITPVHAARRFHARFYLTFLPSTPGFASGDKQDFVPTPDGKEEVISARFIHPEEALSERSSGKIQFMPPQFYILTTLASILRGNQRTDNQRSLLEMLANGSFGRMVINPRAEKEKDSQGRTILSYEGDQLRGGSPGRLHRALVRTAPDGVVTTDITLVRNFDIFTEIEEKAFSQPKL